VYIAFNIYKTPFEGVKIWVICPSGYLKSDMTDNNIPSPPKMLAGDFGNKYFNNNNITISDQCTDKMWLAGP